VTITPTKTTGTSIKDDDAAIGDELVAQIAAGKLPAPTYDDQGYPNTLYFVFFPSTVRINLQGMQSCIKFAGYHFSASYDAQVSCKGKYIPYAVIPDCGLPTNYMAATISHELAEAVSDSDVGPTNPNPLHQSDGAWYLGPSYPCSDIESCPSNCGEIGDVCQSTGSAMIPGTAITAQNMWSQTKNDCVVSNPTVGPKPGPAGPPATSCSPGQHDAGAPDAGSKDGGASSSSSSSGSTSGSSGSSGSSSGSSGTSGSSGGSSGDAGASSGDGAGGDDGGGGTTGCGVVQSGERVGAGTLAALLAMALLGRARRRSKG
jgi:uncharacterized membrane protein YgcG